MAAVRSQDVGSDRPCPARLHGHCIRLAGELGLGGAALRCSCLLEVRDRAQRCPSGRVLVGRWVTQLPALPLAKKRAVIVRCLVQVGVTLPMRSTTAPMCSDEGLTFMHCGCPRLPSSRTQACSEVRRKRQGAADSRLVSAGCSPEQVALSAGAAPTLPLVFLSFTGNQQVDTVSISQVLSNENLISYNKFVQV